MFHDRIVMLKLNYLIWLVHVWERIAWYPELVYLTASHISNIRADVGIMVHQLWLLPSPWGREIESEWERQKEWGGAPSS